MQTKSKLIYKFLKVRHTLYLDRDLVGQAVLRLAIAILHLPALLVSFLRLSADAECCVP